MANFGEELAGVYQKRFIDHALMVGFNNEATYANMQPRPVKGPRVLGVDWDKVGAETSLLAYEWDAQRKLFIPLDKVAIPRTKFTLTHAVQTIIEMDKIHKFDWIYVDKGYGEMQIEQLHLYGKNHPETGLHKKVVGVSFSEKIAVRDPYSKKKDMKDVKPFMINSSVNWFEKGIIALNPKDNQLKEQLEQYSIKGISPTGRPTYTDENEHFVDALNLCVLGFTVNYDAMIRVQLAKRIGAFTALDKAMLSQDGTTLATGLNVDAARADSLDARPKQKEKKLNTFDGAKPKTLKSLGFSKGTRNVGKRASRSKF